MTERIDTLLGYTDIRLIQRPDMFNFSLDSALLASFAPLGKRISHAVDLGTGFAPIPLFLWKRDARLMVDGIEIQSDVADIAKRNVALNGLTDVIRIVEDDIKNAKRHYSSSSIDLITCNPPFFKCQTDACVNTSEHKTLARHEKAVTFTDIAAIARDLLKNKGRFVFVHHIERFDEVLETLRENNLTPKRLRFIHSRNDAPANRFLLDASLAGRHAMEVLPPLYVYEDGDYTDEVKAIFNHPRRGKR